MGSAKSNYEKLSSFKKWVHEILVNEHDYAHEEATEAINKYYQLFELLDNNVSTASNFARMINNATTNQIDPDFLARELAESIKYYDTDDDYDDERINPKK